MALSLTMGLLLFVTPFIKQVNGIWQVQKDASYLEIQIGKQQLEYEIKELTLVEVQPSQLIYKKKGPDKEDKIIFDLYKDTLRKQPGFHPIIVGLKTANCIEHDHVIEMNLETEKGDSYVYFLQK
ncbi:hypothetical protein BW731_07775 [Vagococcus martis]|uniref:Competence protein ComGF n=1 Tax=Vagococcus martis TaxID=1768210 RepID=A0A1V4DHQ2_9ENTE|nr:ComGF family competence protein [Vagococcus martis]OPF88074.1 hypothetical protein BW731_07775 [Vagococcus martis]